MKKITAKEFRKLGLLQEMNRQLLHPMGLALEIIQEPDGTEHFGQVWDYRDDPEGMYFEEGVLSPEIASKVAELFHAKKKVRLEKLGYHVQPLSPFGLSQEVTDSVKTENEEHRAYQEWLAADTKLTFEEWLEKE